MPSGMHVVRPLPPAAILSARVRKRIRVNLKPLAIVTALQYNLLVRNWKDVNRPQFRGKVVFTRDTVNVSVIILNGNQLIAGSDNVTVELLFYWWEVTGTRRHDITPRGEGYPLVYKTNDGKWHTAWRVRHPGTRPKRKTPEINRRMTGKVGPLLGKSVKEGMQ